MFQTAHQANWNNNFPNKTSTVVAMISILLHCFDLVSNARIGDSVTEDKKSNTRSSCSTRYSLHTSLISQIGVSGKQCYHPLPTGNNRPEGWRTKTMAAMNSGHRFCLICTIHCWYMQLLVVSPQLPCKLGAVAPDGPASATLDSCTFSAHRWFPFVPTFSKFLKCAWQMVFATISFSRAGYWHQHGGRQGCQVYLSGQKCFACFVKQMMLFLWQIWVSARLQHVHSHWHRHFVRLDTMLPKKLCVEQKSQIYRNIINAMSIT